MATENAADIQLQITTTPFPVSSNLPIYYYLNENAAING
jgi:hypothetical protein